MTDLVPEPNHDDIDGVPAPAMIETLRGRGSEWQALTSALRSGRMHHAWLLQGSNGIGKASTAFAFARAVLSGTNPDPGTDRDAAIRSDPGTSVARQIALGGHPAFFHLTRPPAERGDGFKTQITVDEVRRLSHFFQSTAGASWRIALVDPADDMNRNAANALLKTLEEPPQRSLFLIVNHLPGAILPTIRSRCRVLRCETLGQANVRQILDERFPGMPDADRQAAAKAGEGSARKAFLNLLGGGLEIETLASRLYGDVEPDWTAIQSAMDSLAQKGRETSATLFREALLACLTTDAKRLLGEGRPAEADRIAAFWQSETERWNRAAAFNLDRKQTILTFFQRLQAVRSGSFVEP